MPDPIDALAALAQISIGLAGFSGIVLAFTSNPESWAPEDRFRMENLLIFALIGAFGTLLALGIAHTGLEQDLCWHIASGSIALVLGVRVIVLASRYRQVLSMARRGGALDPRIGRFAMAGSVLIMMQQIANAAGLLPGPRFAHLYFGLLWPVFIAGFLFYRLIFFRPGNEPGEGVTKSEHEP